MKKFYTILVLMLTAMTVNAASYNIWVKGIQVTDANKNNILGDGKIKYDSDNKYLEFIGANITASSTGTTKQERACVYVSQEVTVLIEGNVTMTGSGDYTPFIAAGGYPIKFTTRVGREANANLTVKSATYRAMEFMGGDLVEFKMMNVNVTGGEYGIYAESRRELKLTRCDFSVTGATNSAPIYGFKSITTEETSNTVKELTYDTTSRYYKQNGNLFSGTIKFQTEKYGIRVDGIEVTARNRKYILGNLNSQVSFDPELNELTLDNANITSSATNAIYINSTNKNPADKTFKIKLIGTNKIVHTGSSAALYIAPNEVDSTLIYSTSTGSLDISANNQYAAMDLYRDKLTFKNCNINLKNDNNSGNAFKGSTNNKATFSFINANVSAESKGPDVLSDVYGLNYYGCYMKTPADAYLTNSVMYSSSSGGSVKKLEIKTGKDDVKPFFFINNEITLEEVGTTSAKVSFNYCLDNFSKVDKIKYHFKVAEENATDTWAQSYDEDVYKGSSTIRTEIKNLKPGTKYILRVRATDEAGNSNLYNDLVFTTKGESYNVIVCGTTLTSANLDEFKAQGITYNPETKVITLENANISYNAGVAISAGFSNYAIDLKGDNTVNGSEAAIGVDLGSLTITTSSNGTLSCSSTEVGSATLSATLGTLTIKGCTVKAYNNNGYGLSGGGLGGLTIDNANVKAYGKQGSICDWLTFEMKNCYVDSPRPTEIGGSEANKNLGIYQNGAPVKGQYVDIKAGVDATNGINGIASGTKMDGKIYNLQGIEVDENYKGVVVKNGKKYLNK